MIDWQTPAALAVVAAAAGLLLRGPLNTLVARTRRKAPAAGAACDCGSKGGCH